ncbi:hypothetical protein [Streptomyces sp. HUAS TT20]|nr:hypothetical protein [Streptomyces sp. HUAS 15-9]UXY32145.1 hypothetical protein N8I87_40180 [Streptomyces sp. HUAS 15-9]
MTPGGPYVKDRSANPSGTDKTASIGPKALCGVRRNQSFGI